MSVLPKEMVVDEILIFLGMVIRQCCMWIGQHVSDLA